MEKQHNHQEAGQVNYFILKRIRMKAFWRIFIYVLLLSIPLLAVVVFKPQTNAGFADEMGKTFSLLGFTILALQPVLSARIRWIEKPFGLDILLLFHRNMALFATALLLAHPFLLVLGDHDLTIFYAADVSAFIWLGRAALLVLLTLIVISSFRLRLGIGFEKWRSLHNILALSVILIGFLHSWLVNDDLQLLSMKIIWSALLLTAMSAYLYHKIIYPFIIKRRFGIVEVKPETENVYTLKMRPRDGSKVPTYLPGQFHFLILHRKTHPEEEHPFTISSHPKTDQYISSTIKISGDFTNTIHLTEPGQQVTIRGPFGRFSYLLYPKEKDLVFIAGGIGITPFMSMLRHMRAVKTDRKILLVYANKTFRDIIFQEELERMEEEQIFNFQVVHILEHPEEGWQGETGFVTGKSIKSYCDEDFHRKSFWICGPPAMQISIIKQLSQFGISGRQIHAEKFSL